MFFRKTRISQLPKKHHDLAKLKQISSILVIDDDPAAFPEVSTLRSEGYNIIEWRKVESLSQLEAGAFDIVVLDIGNVAKTWGPQDGLEILRLLKQTNPDQYVIAFSGQRSIHELEDFWKLADDQMKKPVTAADCKRKLDEALQQRANVEHYWRRIEARLISVGLAPKEIAAIEKQLVRQVLGANRSTDPIRSLVVRSVESEKVQELIVTLSLKFLTAALA